MTVKAVNYGERSVRRIERDGNIIALAFRMANGSWGVFDRDGNQRLAANFFRNPTLAARWCETGILEG